MTAQLKVGFLAYQNPYDKNAYSGVLHYMRCALEDHPGIDLFILGKYPLYQSGFLKRLLKRPDPTFQFDQCEYEGLDVVIAPAASNVLRAHGNKIDIPIILVSDAIPSYIREFYPLEAEKFLDEEEISAFQSVERVIYSSKYMADRASDEFNILKNKVISVAPYGVNLDCFPPSPAIKPKLDPLKLVFVGGNWARKGGDIALATLNELLSRGVTSTLTIVGPGPDATIKHPNVEVVGFLDKQQPAQYQKYESILKNSHLMILPTRADCTPMSISEANAFACPVVVTDVGGVSSLIRDDVNGKLMTLEDGARKWADVIEALTVKNDSYDDIRISSYQFSQLRLSWAAWAQTMYENLSEVARK